MTQASLFNEPMPRSFDQDAMGFLIRFAKRHRGRSFSPEEVTLAAMEKGVVPPDLRQWGRIFQQAAKDGYIRQSEVLFRRVMSNGSLRPGWTAV